MGKSTATLLGIAILAGAAIYIGRAYLFPAAERSERQEAVLTGKLDPRLLDVFVLQDAELPEGVPPPRVGEDDMYVQVSILYPALPEVPVERWPFDNEDRRPIPYAKARSAK